jgi:hypothetical protein
MSYPGNWLEDFTSVLSIMLQLPPVISLFAKTTQNLIFEFTSSKSTGLGFWFLQTSNADSVNMVVPWDLKIISGVPPR